MTGELTSYWCIFRECLVRPHRRGWAGRLTFVLPVNKIKCLKACLGFFSLICHCHENNLLTWIFLRLPLESVNEATQDWTDLGWVQCVFSTVMGNTGIKQWGFLVSARAAEQSFRTLQALPDWFLQRNCRSCEWGFSQCLEFLLGHEFHWQSWWRTCAISSWWTRPLVMSSLS